MNIDFDKGNGLVPAIVQDAKTRMVLMLGYMNQESYQKTLDTKKVTFYSRSKKRLWTKGEESGHFLHLVDIKIDCDSDAFLVRVHPKGATCHKGNDTCWGETNEKYVDFLSELEAVISDRMTTKEKQSYVKELLQKGINKVAQKVGEEAVELVIEAKDNNDALFLKEAADLLFHYMILLQAKGHRLEAVATVLEHRSKNKTR